MNNSDSTVKQSFLNGKKYAILVSFLSAILTLDVANVVKPVTKLYKATGFANVIGDGSDGYRAYVEYVKSQSLWENAQQQYQLVADKIKSDPIAMLEEAEKLRDARLMLVSAQKHFIAEITARTKGESVGERLLVITAAKNMRVPEYKTVAEIPNETMPTVDKNSKSD